MKNVQFLCTIIACTILFTGCKTPKIVWSEDTKQSQVTDPGLNVDTSGLPIDVVEAAPQQESYSTQDEIEQQVPDNGKKSFGIVSDSNTDFSNDSPFGTDTDILDVSGEVIDVDGICINMPWRGYNSKQTKDGTVYYYGLGGGVWAEIGNLYDEVELDFISTALSAIYANRGLTPFTEKVTLCGIDANLITTIDSNDAIDFRVATVVFNHEGNTKYIQITYSISDNFNEILSIFDKTELT